MSGGSLPNTSASRPVSPPISIFTRKCLALRLASPVENVSSPCWVMTNLTMRGLSPYATMETFVSTGPGGMFFSKVRDMPFATSTGTARCSDTFFSFPSST